jgi:hypothetical protein
VTHAGDACAVVSLCIRFISRTHCQVGSVAHGHDLRLDFPGIGDREPVGLV